MLSDLWGYPPSGWEGRGPPWRDLGAWERVVRRAARSLRGREVEWDVWNQPDNPAFWNGTREQFFAVYETAARALVDELGEGAVVGGPSTTKARPDGSRACSGTAASAAAGSGSCRSTRTSRRMTRYRRSKTASARCAR